MPRFVSYLLARRLADATAEIFIPVRLLEGLRGQDIHVETILCSASTKQTCHCTPLSKWDCKGIVLTVRYDEAGLLTSTLCIHDSCMCEIPKK